MNSVTRMITKLATCESFVVALPFMQEINMSSAFPWLEY